jgi:hypothetical protein
MNKTTFIMLEDNDGKKYFCKINNLAELIEFAKNVNMKIYYVKSSKVKALSMASLAKAYCNQNYKTPTEEYEVVSPVGEKKRKGLSVRTKSK